LAVAIGIAVAAKVPLDSSKDEDFIDWYDCKDKANGNYYHPWDCTKFITCSNGYASSRDCAACNPGDPRCPEGKTNFDEPANQCLWPDVARCTGGEQPTPAPTTVKPTDAPTPTTQKPTKPTKPTQPTAAPTDAPTDPPTDAPTDPPTDAPTTQRPTKPTKPTQPTVVPTDPPTEGPPESECDPDCNEDGDCQSFTRCEKDGNGGGRWVKYECGEDLWWNNDPASDKVGQNVALHGGTCTKWDDLTEELRNKYESDETCIPPPVTTTPAPTTTPEPVEEECAWYEIGACSDGYVYNHPVRTEGKNVTLTCLGGLLWDQDAKTCANCGDVTNSETGEACSCP